MIRPQSSWRKSGFRAFGTDSGLPRNDGSLQFGHPDEGQDLKLLVRQNDSVEHLS